VSLVPIGALAALGGAYPSSTLPILAASAIAFFVAGARVGVRRELRGLDAAFVAFLAAAVLQMVPLPSALVSIFSPQAPSMQDMLALQPLTDSRPLSIDRYLTRMGIASAAAAVLVFWAARDALARGGLRSVARTIAAVGFIVALVGTAQRATAPGLLLWTWRPLDPGAQPFGPFVNRNHFATWLLMAASLTTGYFIAHLRSHGLVERASRRLFVRDLLADGTALLLAAAAGLMMAALAASGSRAALLGLATALTLGMLWGRHRAEGLRGQRVAAVAIVLLAGGAVWLNRDAVGVRVNETLSGRPIDRPVIWRETLPIVRDFWATGTGLGTYGQSMLRYQRTATTRLFNQAHNEYLQIVAEGGLLLAVPAALGLWWLIRLIRQRLHADVHESFWIRLGAVGGLCGVALQSVFESALRMPANALLCALLAAIAVHSREPRTEDPRS
jgi:O-antigen ligase